MLQSVSFMGLVAMFSLPLTFSCEDLLQEQTPTLTKVSRANTKPSLRGAKPKFDPSAKRAFDAYLSFQPRLRKFLEAPSSFEESRCSDPRLVNANLKLNATGFLAQDMRSDRKELIPLRMLDSLATPELLAIKGRLTSTLDVLREQQFSQQSVAMQSLDEIAKAEALQFAVVYHVTHYREPKLVYLLTKNKREWIPGVLHALISVHDSKTGHKLCQSVVRVENDTREASVRSRHRAETRERFISELAVELKESSARALRGLGSSLLTDLEPSVTVALTDTEESVPRRQ